MYGSTDEIHIQYIFNKQFINTSAEQLEKSEFSIIACAKPKSLPHSERIFANAAFQIGVKTGLLHCLSDIIF